MNRHQAATGVCGPESVGGAAAAAGPLQAAPSALQAAPYGLQAAPSALQAAPYALDFATAAPLQAAPYALGRPCKSRKLCLAESRRAAAERSGAPVGRDARPEVEDPVLSLSSSRQAAGESLGFLLRVRTNYRSVPGARRQLVATERVSLPLQHLHLLDAANRIRHLPLRAQPPAAAAATAAGAGAGSLVQGDDSVGGRSDPGAARLAARAALQSLIRPPPKPGAGAPAAPAAPAAGKPGRTGTRAGPRIAAAGGAHSGHVASGSSKPLGKRKSAGADAGQEARAAPKAAAEAAAAAAAAASAAVAADGARSAAGGLVVPTASCPAVYRMQWMVLPEFLTEALWERHGYSIQDVRRTLDAFSPRILWQLAISYNRSATNASSRICSDRDLRLTFDGKSTVILKLAQLLKELHPTWESRPSVTWQMIKSDDPNGDGRSYDVNERHLPGLPVHRVVRPAFELLAQHLPRDPLDPAGRSAGREPTPRDGAQESDAAAGMGVAPRSVFSWRGISLIPMDLNPGRDLILVTRVVPWHAYVRALGLPTSLRGCPRSVRASDGHYALLEESFYFYSPAPLGFAASDAAAPPPLGPLIAAAKRPSPA
jgi:hypothetical protein